MNTLPKRVLIISMVLVSIVALISIVDILAAWLNFSWAPFASHWGMDIIFLVSSAIVIYMAIDALAEQK